MTRARRAADPRRDPERHGPHRRAVLVHAERHRAGHPHQRQGPRRRLPDRRDADDTEIASVFAVGVHGTTYGGNPLACAVAGAVFDVINTTEVLDGVKARHALFIEGLKAINGRRRVFRDCAAKACGSAASSRAWQGKAVDVMRAAGDAGLHGADGRAGRRAARAVAGHFARRDPRGAGAPRDGARSRADLARFRPAMFYIRPIAREDLPAFSRCPSAPGRHDHASGQSRASGARIERSLASFAGTRAARRTSATCSCSCGLAARAHRVAGISAIEAAVGLKEPWYNYRVGTLVHASRALGVYTVGADAVPGERSHRPHRILFAVRRPGVRHGKSGALIAKSRLLFIAEFAQRFSPKVIAELRGPLTPKGRARSGKASAGTSSRWSIRRRIT